MSPLCRLAARITGPAFTASHYHAATAPTGLRVTPTWLSGPQGRMPPCNSSRHEAMVRIHEDLLADGIAFHTLAPRPGGATVYMADLD
jgi:hypothetical protein